MTNIKIILASGSPRRKELLAQAGYDFDVCPSLSEEDLEVMAPSEYVMRLAKMKADEVCNRLIAEDMGRRVKKLPERFVVLGADTVVSLNGRILGKPYDYDDAYNTLNSLSDQTHQVYTGVCLIYVEGRAKTSSSFFEMTDVTFYPVSHEEIIQYLATNEPFDKAGSYGIQGKGGLFVKGIKGDYNNVVGLPLARVYHELEELVLGEYVY